MLGLIIWSVAVYSTLVDENIIQNSCVFNTLRIQRKDVLCVDYGLNKKYCNHYALPYEFIIFNEQGLKNKGYTMIKPPVLWDEFNNNKVKIANLYYTFTCSNKDNLPKLILNIVPTYAYDRSFKIELLEIMFTIGGFICVCGMFICFCPNCHYDYYIGLVIGYLMGKSANNHNRVYCS